MSIDFPRAWEIAASVGREYHHNECSFNVSRGGVLCDCDVIHKHPEYTDKINFYGAGGIAIQQQEQAMTTNKPKVQAILVTCKDRDGETVLMRAVRLEENHDPSCINSLYQYEPLIRLSDYEAMRKRAKAAEREYSKVAQTLKGLERVAKVVSDNSDEACAENNQLRVECEKLRKIAGRLVEALEACRDELRWMIERHNQQDHTDGSWLYDYQTVVEADAALAAHRKQESSHDNQ